MRKYMRHPADVPIQISVDFDVSGMPTTACVSGEMVDVSQGGIACDIGHYLAVGCQVCVDITTVSPQYHGLGKVVWCKPQSSGYEVGVCFLNQQESFRSRMVQQVCQIDVYKNMIYEREGRLLDGNEAAAEWIQKYAADFLGESPSSNPSLN
ncbi:PilZ domain-containing protein [Dasania marina]|uniref:PilZ domain-containing protein n=1 Tax=Dasania marina TaxID=471499 RepID=UPI0004B040F2|nr:PilZ domain-containing protein [Dasania marina]